ncbi:MAG: carboxypeptidase-like regulatory domain-containing protein [Bryobacteraceae bacterium]
MGHRMLFGWMVAMAAFPVNAVAQASGVERIGIFGRMGVCVGDPVPADVARYPVTGHVIDDLTGLGIAHATVSLDEFCSDPDARGHPAKNHWRAQAIGNEAGEFRFDNVPAMAAALSVSRDGYQDISQDLPATADAVSVTLRLAPYPSISGVVRGLDGAPMPEVLVQLYWHETSSGWRRFSLCGTMKTAADGSYRFPPPLAPGRYAIVAEAPRFGFSHLPPERDAQGRMMGYVPARYPAAPSSGADSSMELVGGQQARVDFRLYQEAYHRLTGTVAGRDRWPPILQVIARGGPSGRYMLKPDRACCGFEAWVPNGRFLLDTQFTSVDGEFVGSMPVEVADSDVDGIAFKLSRRTKVEIPIEIRAAPGASEELIRQFWFLQFIELKPDGSGLGGPMSTQAGIGRTSAPRKESVTAFTGSYAVALMAMGNTYAQSMTSGGADLIRGPLLVDPDHAPETIRVVVAEGAKVEGVTRRDGKPGRAWVYAIPDQPDGRLVQPFASDADGKFRMQGLAPAGYLFFASDKPLPLDLHNEAEIGYWRRYGQSPALEAGKTTPLELAVHTQ